MKFFVSLLIILLIGCGDTQLQEQVKNYKGEGRIQYIEGFGIVGAPGVSIDFSTFPLKDNFSNTYQITGIPKLQAYYVCFKTQKIKLTDLSPEGILSYRISRNGKIMSESTSKIKKMVHASGGGEEELYFEIDEKGSSYFDVTNNIDSWKFSVFSKNILNKNQTGGLGYFCIKRSGGK
jgi:hypothetical protein